VLCERGSVEFTFRAGGVQVDSRDAGGTSLLVYENGQAPRPLAYQTGDGYVNQAAAFVACARSNQPPTDGTPEQGRLAVMTALAARQSIETGEVVRL
jgi:predicted dehydrogenase